MRPTIDAIANFKTRRDASAHTPQLKGILGLKKINYDHHQHLTTVKHFYKKNKYAELDHFWKVSGKIRVYVKSVLSGKITGFDEKRESTGNK